MDSGKSPTASGAQRVVHLRSQPGRGGSRPAFPREVLGPADVPPVAHVVLEAATSRSRAGPAGEKEVVDRDHAREGARGLSSEDQLQFLWLKMGKVRG